MLVTLTSKKDISPADLAQALAKAEPAEFAEFWLKFSAKCSDDKLDLFAQVMAPELGSNRKTVFKKLYEAITFYEQMSKRKLTNDRGQV